MKHLFQYIKKYKWYMIIGPVFKLIEAILELFNPLLIAKIIDEGVIAGSMEVIIRFAIILVICNILGFGFSVVGQKCASLTSTKVSYSMRHDVFEHVAKFSHAELDKFGTASLINRLTNDVGQVETAIGVFMRVILRAPFLLIGAFVLSLMINIKMSLLFLVLIPIFCLVLVWYTKKTYPHFNQIRVKLDRISTVTKENLSGTRVIRSFNKQDIEQNRFEVASEDYTKTNIKIAKISALLDPIFYFIVDAATVALLLLGGWQINVGGMTQGDIIALIDYVAVIMVSLLLLSQVIVVFVRTHASLKRIGDVLDTEPSVKDEEYSHKFRRDDYESLMEFRGVGFNYTQDHNNKLFIKDLSFTIKPGQTIGIIGGTGSGKTTIASLMTRFYDPTEGEVYYKDRNLKEYTLDQLRHEISIVQQRSTLFSGSLRENMKLRNDKATDEEIINALKISQAWGFVSEWRNGLDHQIMAGGKNVSGGQMQRLTIARALIDKPELLILDDSSSALDFLTDSNLRKELKKLDSTLVLISQRATSIQHADFIIVLDNGDVIGMGKHSELLKKCDVYREIYESQSK